MQVQRSESGDLHARRHATWGMLVTISCYVTAMLSDGTLGHKAAQLLTLVFHEVKFRNINITQG